MLRKRFYIPIGFCIIAVVAIGIFAMRSETPKEPIKVYKTVMPADTPAEVTTGEVTDTSTGGEITEVSTSGHMHADGTWHGDAHTEETRPNTDGYDWRDDPAFDDTLVKKDPWKQTYPQQASTDDTDDTYPPRDWYKTEDPELHAEYFYAQLLKQFGDIPEVHIIGEHKLQIAKKGPITDDQWIKYLEASQVLWPNEKNAELLEALQKDKVEEHQ
ncbi:hypothetical protein F4054_02115 [Candidatus Poribacteria bacterium]|nr:hypothetical protein [Candidatus Poribacteria bacterium]